VLPPPAAAAGAATCSSVHLQREGQGRSIKRDAGDKATEEKAHSRWRARGAHPAKLCPTVSTLSAARCRLTVGSTFIVPIVRRYACRKQPAPTLATESEGDHRRSAASSEAAEFRCCVGIRSRRHHARERARATQLSTFDGAPPGAAPPLTGSGAAPRSTPQEAGLSVCSVA
jgi:hypothetical protein